jgi:hypothetical protein
LNILEPAFGFALAERKSDRGAVAANALVIASNAGTRANQSIGACFAGNCSIFS